MVVCFGIYSNLVAITNVRDKPFHTFTILPPFIIIKRIELQSGLYLAAQGYGPVARRGLLQEVAPHAARSAEACIPLLYTHKFANLADARLVCPRTPGDGVGHRL